MQICKLENSRQNELEGSGLYTVNDLNQSTGKGYSLIRVYKTVDKISVYLTSIYRKQVTPEVTLHFTKPCKWTLI